MKNIILFLSVIFFISCSDNDTDSEVLNLSSLYGTWQFIGADYGTDIDDFYPNGYTYTFHQDGTFNSDIFDNCSGGTYVLDNNQIILIFDCNGLINSYTNNYLLSDGYLFLSPENSLCIEGCSSKFQKISDLNNQ
jgi:hypothetical protein